MTTPNVPDLHRRACESFGQRVHAVDKEQWQLGTPCSEWNVRELVNHVVGENLWTPPLVAGQIMEQVGDPFDGDVLGDDPVRALDTSVGEAVDAVGEPGALERTVHLSFGDFPGEFYALQLFADDLIHSWDLARAIGAPEQLDPKLVAACADWFASLEDAYRGAGAIRPRPEGAAAADRQSALLAMFGRDAGAAVGS